MLTQTRNPELISVTTYRVRSAREDDLPTLARFEAKIAEISFPDSPIVDLDAHHSRLAKAMARDAQGMFVAEAEDPAQVVGWLWVSLRQNFATGETYAYLRSFAVDDTVVGSTVTSDLFDRGLAFARTHRVREVRGKVHADNVPMRLVYRAFGFQVEHLTMRLIVD